MHLDSVVKFFKQIWARRVAQVGALYLGVAWVLLQVAIALESSLELPNWIDQSVIVLLAVGFPMALILAWAQESKAPETLPSKPPTTDAEHSRTHLGKPSIAVLPFVNMSDEKEKEYFADGMTEDIITGLSLSKHLSVKSRTSTFTYKGQSPDIRRVGQDLDATYVVEGSVRPIGDRVRITVQLITADTGDHLWAEKYDRPASQLFEIQDDVIASITSAVGAVLKKEESLRASRLTPNSLSAWQAVQRASFYRGADGNSEEETNKSIEELRTATQADPDYAYAHSMLAWILNYRGLNGLTDNPVADFQEAQEHLQKGLSLATDDPFNLNICGGAFGYVGQFAKAEELSVRALEIDPNYADVYFNLGSIYSYMGRFEEAEQALDRVENMAPSGPMSRYYKWYRGSLRSLEGQHAEAAELIRTTIDQAPSYASPYFYLAISLDALGRRQEATETIARALKMNPNLTLKRMSIIVSAHPNPEEGKHRLQVIEELWPKKV